MFLTKQRGFTSREVQHLTGLSNRNLQYWDEQGVFTPSLNRPAGRGAGPENRRLYSALDVLVLQAVASLKRKGMSFQRIRKTLETLRDEMGIEKPFHAALRGSGRVSLLTDGKNFYLCRNDRQVVDILKHSGQYLLLPLGELAQDLRVRVRELQRMNRAGGGPRGAAVARSGVRRAARAR